MDGKYVVAMIFLAVILIVCIAALRREGAFVSLVRLWPGTWWRLESRATGRSEDRAARVSESEVIMGDDNQFLGPVGDIVGGDLISGHAPSQPQAPGGRTTRVRIGQRNAFAKGAGDIVGGTKVIPEDLHDQ
jgi:hypothetical protein